MRSKDRLAELKSIAEDSIYNDTVELHIKQANGDACTEHIDRIFKEVDQIRIWIHDINGNTQLTRRLHADPTYHTNKYLQEQLDSTVTKTNATGLKVCGALRQFEQFMRTLCENDVRARIARLQYATIRRLYADALGQHHATLQSIRNTQHALLQEQIKLTNLSISEDECQSLLESNNIQLFVDNIETQTQEARQALRDVEARHAELLKVETSLKEVHELFMQMAQLVSTQQDLIDTVEYYAVQTSSQVKSGGQELMKGSVTQTKARKKKMSLIICLVCGFLVVLIILIIT